MDVSVLFAAEDGAQVNIHRDVLIQQSSYLEGSERRVVPCVYAQGGVLGAKLVMRGSLHAYMRLHGAFRRIYAAFEAFEYGFVHLYSLR